MDEGKLRKKEYNKKYYEANKSRILAKNAEYRVAHKVDIDAQRRRYRAEHKQHIAEKNRQYLPTRKQRIKARRLKDPHFRISEVIRSKVHKVIKGMPTSYITLLGMDMDTFRDWMSFQFEAI